MVSRKLIEAVKLSNKRAYQIAHEAGLHPATLSKILNGIDKVEVGDSRVMKIAKVLDLRPEDCF